jgi:hypothetical protein
VNVYHFWVSFLHNELSYFLVLQPKSV